MKRELLDYGLKKYQRLATFNIRIIFFSVALDLMIIGTMSYPNPFMYVDELLPPLPGRLYLGDDDTNILYTASCRSTPRHSSSSSTSK